VYLDYAATTPVDPRVAEAMVPYITEHFGNPASNSHAYGWKAEEAVEHARKQVAKLVNADPREIIWTSGATESDNLAIKGAARFYREIKGNHLITLATEHKAVIDPFKTLEAEGFETKLLAPMSNGLLDLATLEAAIKPETALVSIMLVNNEIGVIQDIAAIGSLCRSHGIVFHVDAAQATGKVAIDLATLPVDLMSFSAHKTYGPKGIGALYVRRKPRVRLAAEMHGGGHERGMRSGTLAAHQIVGMGAAFEIAQAEMQAENVRLAELQQRLLQGLQAISGTHINGDLTQRVPNNINISFDDIEGESLMLALKGIAVSSGSACTSASLEPSYVLRALGLSTALASSAIRLSIGRFTTVAEIDVAINLITTQVSALRAQNKLEKTA